MRAQWENFVHTSPRKKACVQTMNKEFAHKQCTKNKPYPLPVHLLHTRLCAIARVYAWGGTNKGMCTIEPVYAWVGIYI